MAARQVLDSIDRRLIDGLQIGPRATTRALASDADISESVAASRIRRMIERGVLRPTITYDWMKAGYRGLASMWVNVEAGSADAASAALSCRPDVISAATMLGEFELLVDVLLSDELQTPADVRVAIDGIDGLTVERAETVLASHVARRMPEQLEGFVAEVPALPDPVIPLDDIDRRLCAALSANARTSNREIARAINTSERTVRTRLGRLEESGLIHLKSIVDPSASASQMVTASVGVLVSGDSLSTVASVRDDDQVVGCVSVTGTEQLRFLVSAPTTSDLRSFVSNRINTQPNVRSTSVHVIGDTVVVDQRWSHTSTN